MRLTPQKCIFVTNINSTSMQEAECKCNAGYIPLPDTGFFSRLVLDYIGQSPSLRPFYEFQPDLEGMQQAIEQRKKYPVDRHSLVNALKEQYSNSAQMPAVERNIRLLQDENTFTICTAHQPNLATGYAYFIYKIMHAIVLAAHLGKQFPSYNFVPVYYIGSEDDDIEELGFFRYNDHSFRWRTPQTGAVGSMRTEELTNLFQDFFRILGPTNEHTEYLKELLTNAYLRHNTISEATRYLVHTLMGKYGIVVIDPQDKILKKAFTQIATQELCSPAAHRLVQETNRQLQADYSTQAFVRPINFFYLDGGIRQRIEMQEDTWKVVGTGISWTGEQLRQTVNEHPEYFSPNVILRGLYQESILPNVAFIGGGSELAYWMQLKSVFEHYKVFYPTLVLRQSVQFISAYQQDIINKLHFSDRDIFLPAEQLVKDRISQLSQNDLKADGEWHTIVQALQSIRAKAARVDKSLERSVEAALKKMQYQVEIVEKKIYKAEKRNLSTEIDRIYKMKAMLFPGNHSLQERYYTFMQEYAHMGDRYFECLEKTILPFGDQFLIINN